MAIFEHRPARNSGRRQQADLSIHDDLEASTDDLLDLPLDDALPSAAVDDDGIRPSASETVPIATQPVDEEAAPRGTSWGPTVRPTRGSRKPPRKPPKPPAERRQPESIGHRGSGGRWLLFGLLLLLPLAVAAGYWLNRSPAVAQLSTEMVDFGELRLGQVAQDVFEITNQGQVPLQVEEFRFAGDAAAEFEVEGGDCLARQLAEGVSCRVRLAFRPSATGARKARLEILSTSLAGVRSLPLLGSGAAPRLRVSPPEVDFLQHVVGTASGPQQVWVENGGSAPLHIERARLAGLGAADFVLRRDDCSRQQLGPGERCALSWAFLPTRVGERQAEMTLDSDAPPTQGTRLMGVGLPQEPELRMVPERLELDATALGEVSASQFVDIFNDGNGPLKVHDLRPSTPATVAAGPSVGTSPMSAFLIESEDCTGAEVVPGGSCRIAWAFRPQREGEHSAFFEILHSAGEGRHLLPLVGRGLAPQLNLSPRRLSFGEAPLGDLSRPQELTFVNRGTAPLRIEKISLEGADAAAFEMEPVACLEDDLAPQATCRLAVRFRPRRDGPHRSELVVLHNAEGGQERLPVSGVGTSPKLDVSPANLDLGDVQVGRQGERTLTLKNSGRAPMNMGRLRLASGPVAGFALAQDECSGRRLTPGGHCQVTVQFKPKNEGSRVLSLIIEHSVQARGGSSGKRHEVPLRAYASAPPPPRLEVSPGRFEFAAIAVGEAGRIRTLVLRNSGQGQLEIDALRLSGPQADSFQLVPGTCAESPSLAAGQECTVGVRFAPTSPGGLSGTLEIRHNGPGGVQRLELVGLADEAVSGESF